MAQIDVIVRKIMQQISPCVRRVGKSTDWTGAANFNIFQVLGADISIKRIWGHVTTACTGALLVPYLNFTPTGGGATTALCALAVGSAWPINTILTWSGTVAGVLTPTSVIGHSAASGTATETFSGNELLMVPGIIGVVNAPVDASAAIDWYIEFTPNESSSVIAL
jgi:hypothetical protein